MNHMPFLGIPPRWIIGFFALFHTSVGSLAVGLAFIVVVVQIIGFRKRTYRYDLFAKRTQLFHVCIYNIGTINAIGLVFALSGLFPQFWAHIMNNFFWPFVIEEFLFLLLATTLTFHYFFWDKLWGHKRMHILLGSLMIPFFFLQINIINSIGGFMMTPGYGEAEATLRSGIIGYDFKSLYNPSFLMLQLHRSFASISYAGFFMAGWCGIRLYTTKVKEKIRYYEDCGLLSFNIAFASLLSLPVIGYFYSHVLKTEAPDAFWNIMLGRGDVHVGGVDIWWLKHLIVAAMLGAALGLYSRMSRAKETTSLPAVLVYGISGFYLMFYVAMGMVMTWAFFFWTVTLAVGSALLGRHMVSFHKGSGKAIFLYMGILSFTTVMLGGYAREAGRPRFVERIANTNEVYVPEERQQYLFLPIKPEDIEGMPARPPEADAAQLIRRHCVRCHGLDRLRAYPRDDWDRVVRVMRIYGTRISDTEAAKITAHLAEGKTY